MSVESRSQVFWAEGARCRVEERFEKFILTANLRADVTKIVIGMVIVEIYGWVRNKVNIKYKGNEYSFL